jgi:hypothetical protein
MNLEVCTACAPEVRVESLEMSNEWVELLKRGHKEYKVLEAIVKGWKVKVIETISEVPPKCATCASEAHTTDMHITDMSGTDASLKVCFG